MRLLAWVARFSFERFEMDTNLGSVLVDSGMEGGDPGLRWTAGA